MRQLTTQELERIRILTENSVQLALIEPTATGLSKSIMDATGVVRTYLKEMQLHDYAIQLQGQENKVFLNAKLLTADNIIPSVASLYRPVTKNGDPRIWFKNLGSYTRPNNILAIIAFEGTLFVVDITQVDIVSLIALQSNNPVKELVGEINRLTLVIADELLFKLRKIAARGPIQSQLSADTSVGRTLECLLGIEINSSKKPDYKGIELKSFRARRGNRKTLFAQVPDWHLSKFKSSAEILDHFGYQRGHDYKLYCTVSALAPNSQGLRLRVDNKVEQLLENSNRQNIGDFVAWELDRLHRRLEEKHNETFWIKAETHMIHGREYFTYAEVEHTRKPIISQFDILLEQGIITLDHLIKRTAANQVVEKGPLFKIKPMALNLLFPPSKLYVL